MSVKPWTALNAASALKRCRADVSSRRWLASALRPLVGALAVATFGLVAAPAWATHDGLPSIVLLAAEKSEVTIPDTIRVFATANRHLDGSGYRVRILDQADRVVGGPCSSGTGCPGQGSGAGWSNNPNPQPQSFRAELLGPYGGVVATSNQVTVEVRKFVWNVIGIVASPQSQVVPGYITFTANVDRSVYGTGYEIYMYDEDNPASLITCSSAAWCSRSIARQWADNVKPRPGRVRVEVRGWGGDLASNTVYASAPFRRFIFTVGLAFSTQTDANGSIIHKATATTDRNVYGTPYQLKIRRADGTEICTVPQGACFATVTVGNTYRAVVEDSQGRNFGDSGAWTLTADGPRQEVIDDVDLAHLAALFASSSAVCNALAEYPGSHLMEPPSTLSDQYRVCVASANAGKAKIDVLRDIATGIGGAAALGGLWYLQREGVRPSPPPGTPWTADDVKAPKPIPLPLVPQVDKLADTLVQQNPTLSQPIADEIAWQCQWLTGPLGLNAKRECGAQPIFASGNDVPRSTEHDIDALSYWPPWVALNYRHQSETPGPREWMNAEPECADRLPGVTSCDEYPFWATMQGGSFALKQPHLELIPFLDNRDQGLRYGNFILNCHMNTGDAFLGIPLAPELGIPTQTRVCNGH